MGGRGVAGTCVVLALALACFRQLQPIQMMKQAHIDCAATAMDMTSDAVPLVLLGAPQALMSFASVAATSRVYTFLLPFLRRPFTPVAATSRVYTFLSMFLSPLTALKLLAVLTDVVHLATGAATATADTTSCSSPSSLLSDCSASPASSSPSSASPSPSAATSSTYSQRMK